MHKGSRKYDFCFIKLAQRVERSMYLPLGVNCPPQGNTLICGYPDYKKNYAILEPEGGNFKAYQYSKTRKDAFKGMKAK